MQGQGSVSLKGHGWHSTLVLGDFQNRCSVVKGSPGAPWSGQDDVAMRGGVTAADRHNIPERSEGIP